MRDALQSIFLTGRRMWNVLRHLPVTVEYPFVSKPLPVLARARLRNHIPDCTGCRKCSDVCPTKAIVVEGEEYSPHMKRPLTTKGIPLERSVAVYQVDYSRCVYCGICIQECPTQSLSFDRQDFLPQGRLRDLTIDLVHLPRSMRRF